MKTTITMMVTLVAMACGGDSDSGPALWECECIAVAGIGGPTTFDFDEPMCLSEDPTEVTEQELNDTPLVSEADCACMDIGDC